MENEQSEIPIAFSENSEVLKETSNTKENKREIRSKKLLERLKLSGLEFSPKINNVKTDIDLSQPSDKEDGWLQQRFPSLVKTRRIANTESTAAGRLPSKLLKKTLRSSLLAKNRAELQKRRELYREDNQIDQISDEEEEEELYKKKKKKVVKPITESDEEADEDWVENNSEGDDEEESDASNENESETEDSENEDDKVNETLLEDNTEALNPELELTQENSNPPDPTLSNEAVFPSSLSQWFNDDSDRVEDSLVQLEERAKVKKVVSNIVDDELLNLCSGRFESQAEESSDSMDEEEEEFVLNKKKNTNTQNDSGDTDLRDSMEQPEKSQSSDLSKAVEVETVKHFILESDEDSETEETTITGGSSITQKAEQEEENTDLIVEDQEGEDDDVDDDDDDDQEEEEKNGENSEDDELAEYKRFLKADHKKKLKKDNYFDDEASLSGDDVGSDLDEDLDENNEYELEEGDNDDVPDADVIQLQNHKHLMKQELQKEHREIVRLQERLLADGDLGGTRTNRSFRIKLREDENSLEMTEDVTTLEVEEDMENDEDIKLGSEALRMKQELEQAVALNVSAEMTAEECALENAGLAALTATQSIGVRKKVPSLLNKAPLAAMFKETTSVVVKQLYTSNVTTSTTTVAKRVLMAETESVAKRRRGNLLDVLND